MKFSRILLILFCLGCLDSAIGLFDPLTIAGSAIAAGAVYLAKFYDKCKYEECCNEDNIKNDINAIRRSMKRDLFGQHIAISLVPSALHARKNSKKATSLSFHGPPGTGKNYVARMIVEDFYKKGTSSKFYHSFYGRSSFPNPNKLHQYQEELRSTIIEQLKECPESIFVFDEVDMMAPQVLDILVPFLDYGPLQIREFGKIIRLDTSKAIFIFLSNTGSQRILEIAVKLWEDGVPRENMNMSHFESLIAMGAFNEKGGFERSDTISTSLIDHYVPFLPLEQSHVRLCIEKAFETKGVRNPAVEDIKEVMNHVTFGPTDYDLYAKSGCKRVDAKVGSIIYQSKEYT